MAYRKDLSMTGKFIGAILIVLSCGGLGFKIAAAHRREEHALRQLIGALDYMECELQYRLTPLSALCRQASQECEGALRKIFLQFAIELDAQISPDAERCMLAALNGRKDVPSITMEALKKMGRSMGRFDMEGQLKGFEALRQECRGNLDRLGHNRDSRLRSYQTLGLCAGAAVVILFI